MAADRLDVTDAPGFVHATALVVGERGVLIRGPSGAGKSRLALILIAEAGKQQLFARLVGDDRVALAACHDRLVARPHPATAGLVERRFEGIAPVSHEPGCVVRCVVDLTTGLRPRLPEAGDRRAELLGVPLPRFTLTCGLDGVYAATVLDLVLHAEL